MKGFFSAIIFAAPMALALMACETSSTSPDPSSDTEVLLSAGHDIVKDQCLTCHSLSTSSRAPMPSAPALSTALSDRNVESLADDFREGIHVGDPRMPEFDFGSMEADAITAYLISIQQ